MLAAMATQEDIMDTTLTYSVTNQAEGAGECENLSCYFVLSDSEKYVISWMCSLAGPITFLENILVLVAIGTSSRLRKLPSFLFIGSLALADILASSFFPVIFLDFHLTKRIDNASIYLFKLGGITMAFSGSVGSLLLTSVDRYLCIYHAPRYKLVLTRRRALFGIAALWTNVVVISFLPLLGWSCKINFPCSWLFPYIDTLYMGCWAGLMLGVLSFIVVVYMLILWKAHQHESGMERPKVGRSTLGRQARMRLDIRLARTFSLILMILVLCWLPSLSIMLVDVARKLSRKEQRAFAFCGTMCLVNSAVNPLLYALRCRELRRALLHLVRRVRKMCTHYCSACPCIQKMDSDAGQADKKDGETISESLDKNLE